MIDKVAPSVAPALEGVHDGATVLIGGFGTAGIPNGLVCVERVHTELATFAC